MAVAVIGPGLRPRIYDLLTEAPPPRTGAAFIGYLLCNLRQSRRRGNTARYTDRLCEHVIALEAVPAMLRAKIRGETDEPRHRKKRRIKLELRPYTRCKRRRISTQQIKYDKGYAEDGQLRPSHFADEDLRASPGPNRPIAPQVPGNGHTTPFNLSSGTRILCECLGSNRKVCLMRYGRTRGSLSSRGTMSRESAIFWSGITAA